MTPLYHLHCILLSIKRSSSPHPPYNLETRAREIVGFAGSGLIFENENRFISRQEAEIGP